MGEGCGSDFVRKGAPGGSCLHYPLCSHHEHSCILHLFILVIGTGCTWQARPCTIHGLSCIRPAMDRARACTHLYMCENVSMHIARPRSYLLICRGNPYVSLGVRPDHPHAWQRPLRRSLRGRSEAASRHAYMSYSLNSFKGVIRGLYRYRL